jgi:alkanesulfonate monooxygenase SsuD/methylene tetrahydromethanopterin reductase-like flavin-dependent oxidoreductase (luciferase family)
MWTEDEVTYKGKYYDLKGAISQPKPIQRPHIPIWVAGGGEKVTLRIAARHAQYSNFGGELDQFKHKSSVLAGHCSDLGTDFEAITRSSNFNILVGETKAEVDEKLGWLQTHMTKYVSKEKGERFAASYRATSGTPEQLIEQLKTWETAGLAYTIVNFADAAYDRSSMELFAREVIPAFS